MKRIISFILLPAVVMFAGCKRNTETPEQGNEPTATALTTATPAASAGETEPDVFPDAEETADAEPGTADAPTKAPDITPADGGQNPADTPGVTTAPSVTAAPGGEVTPTPNGGVEMPRVPLGIG